MTCNIFSYQYAVDKVPSFFQALKDHGYMVEASIPLLIIKNFLGHSSVQTTEIYAKITQQYLDFKTEEWNQMWLSAHNQKSLKNETLSFLDVHYQG